MLDRDFDFHLNEVHPDSRVKYYNYYELENYLFEDSLLKIVLKNVCNYSDMNHYYEMIRLLHEIEKACKPYVLLCFLREVHYRKDILTEDQLAKVLEIIKKNPSSMMQMRNLGIANELERIPGYIESELNKVGLSIEIVLELIDDNDYESSSIMGVTEPLDLFKFAITGKLVSNSLSYFFKYILTNSSELNQIKSKGNLSSIITRLKLEWIPTLSQDLSELLKEIETEFEMEQVVV